MTKAHLGQYVAIIFGILVIAKVFLTVWVQPLGFDDAFNLQIAKSLSRSFIYQSTYLPRYIYDARITTNGPIQYLGAGNITLFGDRLGLCVTLMMASSFLMYATYRYSTNAFIALLVLIYSYPPVLSLMNVFFGEIIACGFLILGIDSVKRILTHGKSNGAINFSWILPALFFAA